MRNKALSSMLWRFAERMGAQAVGFIVTIILARVLLPEDFANIALITVIITILNIFVDSGFASALIQKKDADELDFSSVFYFNIVLCIVLYSLLWMAAPGIARFYEQEELKAVIRVLGLIIPVSGIKNVQQAYISRNLLFKRFFFATLGGTLGAAAIGIAMALNGFGIWALVVQHLFNTIIDTLILWFSVKWRPQMRFSLVRLKALFSFGWKLLASGLLDSIYADIRQLLIGKLYAKSDLAFYNRGKQIPHLVVTNINASIDSVLLPTMSQKQNDVPAVKTMTRRAITVSGYLMWPMMIGISMVAEPLIRLLLTDKWIFCVPYLRIFCFQYAFYPIHTANLNAIKAMGKSDVFLRLEIWKKVIGMAVLLVTFRLGVLAMAYSLIVTAITSSIINASPNKKLLGYRYLEQLRDMLPSFLLSLVMAGLIYPIRLLNLPDLATLLLQAAGGVLVYVAGSYLGKLESFFYIITMIRSFTARNREGLENQVK